MRLRAFDHALVFIDVRTDNGMHDGEPALTEVRTDNCTHRQARVIRKDDRMEVCVMNLGP